MPKRELSSELISRLKKYFVPRCEIAKELDRKTGIARMLLNTAKKLEPPHVVERRYKGQQFKVEYHLRPTKPGEDPEPIVEV